MLPIVVVLHGLILLLPSPGGVSPMTALAVATKPANAPNPLPACYAQHTANLTVKTSSNECSTAGCVFTDPTCTCTLDGDDISLQIVPASTPSPKPLTSSAPRPLPFSSDSAQDFSYLVNLKRLGFTLDMGYAAPSIPPSLVPNLAARLIFPFDSVISCNLATRPINNTQGVYAFNFRQVKSIEQEGEVSQAAGQIALAQFTPSGSGSQSVVLTLTKLAGGGTPRSLTLLAAGTDGYVITFRNERTGGDVYKWPDEPCDDGVGRDFAFLYNLGPAATPIPWDRRLLPHVNYSNWESTNDVDPVTACDLAYRNHDAMSRPICPMATYN
jgi:hypothetical protein